MKQVVEREIKSDTYILCRWSRTVESMVFTLFSLHKRRPSRDGCRGKLSFLYTPLTKYYLNSAGHTFLIFSTTNGQESADTNKIRDTERDISTSPHSKQNKRFLATTTALNTNETSKYTYELLLTSADKDCFSHIYIYIYIYIYTPLNH